MLLEFDAERLEKAINAFHKAMGVSISILYEDYSVLGSKKLSNPYCRLIQSNKKGLIRCMDQNCTLLDKCKKSKKSEMHVCHAGLVEIAVPIIYADEVIGYVSFGHVKAEGSPERSIADLPINMNESESLYSALPKFESEKIASIIEMAEMFIEHIMTQRILRPKENGNFERIRQYVLDNYDKKLTAQSIANGAHLSKTAIYNAVKSHSGLTVNEYINTVKVEKSKALLRETDMSVEAIAEKLRFSSSAYYSIIFKKLTGCSPSVFRRQNP